MEESNEEVLAGLGMALGGVVDAAAEAEEEEEREEDHLDADEESRQAVLDVARGDGVVGAEPVGDADEVEDEAERIEQNALPEIVDNNTAQI